MVSQSFAVNVPSKLVSTENLSEAVHTIEESSAWDYLQKETQLAYLNILKLELLTGHYAKSKIEGVDSKALKKLAEGGVIVATLSLETAVALTMINVAMNLPLDAIYSSAPGYFVGHSSKVSGNRVQGNNFNLIDSKFETFETKLPIEHKAAKIPRATLAAIRASGANILANGAFLAIGGVIITVLHNGRKALILDEANYEVLMNNLESKIANLQRELASGK